MPWFKVDDNLAIHPKVIRAGNEAMGLWARAGSWSAQQLTEGFIPADIVALLQGEDAAPKLVAAGLWTEADGGYAFHEWDERQPTKESVLAERQASRDRQRRAREKAKSQRESRRDDGVTDGVSHGYVTPGVTVPPTRPDPTRPTSSNEEGVPRKRGSRIDPDFAITDEMREWAAKEVPLVALDAKLPEFIDYWIGVPGQKGVKSDWVSTWRNGMRKQQQFAERDKPRRTDYDPDGWMQ